MFKNWVYICSSDKKRQVSNISKGLYPDLGSLRCAATLFTSVAVMLRLCEALFANNVAKIPIFTLFLSEIHVNES